MGLLARAAGVRADDGSGRPGPLHDWWYGAATMVASSGVRVNADRALSLPPFWKACRILSENLASFACHVHERRDRGHRQAPGHPLDYTLSRAWNADMTAFEGWETAVLHVVLRGRMIALKRFVPARGGPRLQLYPLHPDRVTKARGPNGVLTYTVQSEGSGKPVPFGASDVFELRGLSMDGVHGLEMMTYARDSVGAMVAAESMASRFFKSGTTAALQVVNKDPTPLGDEGLENLRRSIAAYLTGLENTYGVFATDEPIELKPIGIDPEKSQLLATRELTAVQVANWFNLPPGMLGDSKTPTFASSKQFRQDLADLCFRPWVERFEARIDYDLLDGLAPGDEGRFFAKFNMSALLRGDAETRAKVHRDYLEMGAYTPNEVRLDEDKEPLPGLDDPIMPLNMGRVVAPSASARLDPAALVTLQVATHLVRKEQAAATKAATKFAADAEGWQGWLREFYAGHAREVSERLRLPGPVARAYAARQGLRLAERGVAAVEEWEWTVAPELATLALQDHAVSA